MEEEKPKKTVAKKSATKKTAVKKSAVKNDIPNMEDIPQIDRNDAVSIIQKKAKILVYMKNGQSYHSGDLIFTAEKPFKLLDETEAYSLISSFPEKFDYATRDQVEKFYSIG